MITPFEAGPLDLLLSVSYTDDFNRPAVITHTLTVEVLEAIPMEPIDPGACARGRSTAAKSRSKGMAARNRFSTGCGASCAGCSGWAASRAGDQPVREVRTR